MQNVSDRSYGIVPVIRQEGQWHFLIVKHLGGHWAFPKGHPENVESPKEAASRELKEETGLIVKRFFQIYPFNEQYVFFHARRRISKTVIYYLAEVEGELAIQKEELLEARLLPFQECCELLSYPRSVQICQQSYDFLQAGSAANRSRASCVAKGPKRDSCQNAFLPRSGSSREAERRPASGRSSYRSKSQRRNKRNDSHQKSHSEGAKPAGLKKASHEQKMLKEPFE